MSNNATFKVTSWGLPVVHLCDIVLLYPALLVIHRVTSCILRSFTGPSTWSISVYESTCKHIFASFCSVDTYYVCMTSQRKRNYEFGLGLHVLCHTFAQSSSLQYTVCDILNLSPKNMKRAFTRTNSLRPTGSSWARTRFKASGDWPWVGIAPGPRSMFSVKRIRWKIVEKS